MLYVIHTIQANNLFTKLCFMFSLCTTVSKLRKESYMKTYFLNFEREIVLFILVGTGLLYYYIYYINNSKNKALILKY